MAGQAFARRTRGRLRRLWGNTGRAGSKLARRVLEGRYAWLAEGIIGSSIPGPWIAPDTPGPSTAEDIHRQTG